MERRWIVGLGLVGVLVALAVTAVVVGRPPEPAPRASEDREAAPAVVNDGWFIEAPPGTQMSGNKLVEEAGQLDLYLPTEEARIYEQHGFQWMRTRSYYSGSFGGGVFKLVEVDDPMGTLESLDRLGDGLGQPHPDLPHGYHAYREVEMEDHAGHAVSAYFHTYTFVVDSQLVQVEAYAVQPVRADEQALAFARDQLELLRSGPGEGVAADA